MKEEAKRLEEGAKTLLPKKLAFDTLAEALVIPLAKPYGDGSLSCHGPQDETLLLMGSFIWCMQHLGNPWYLVSYSTTTTYQFSPAGAF